ncbi:thiol-disulfide oxidoreductase DCC family protein [Actinotalea sp.]|uniref:thiol-disulfide oxidoreductase DCC family protein n=1 Tax=Actinotalea sp. TaxID=1872145 RepID=UPI003568EDA4
MPRPLLLYDADCGFCLRAVRWVPRLGLATGVTALQDVDLAGLGVDAGRAERELPFLDADGAVSYGHRAVAGALLTGNRVLVTLGRVLGSRVLDRPSSFVYGWVARHRGSLPGGTVTCQPTVCTGAGSGVPEPSRRWSSAGSSTA